MGAVLSELWPGFFYSLLAAENIMLPRDRNRTVQYTANFFPYENRAVSYKAPKQLLLSAS